MWFWFTKGFYSLTTLVRVFWCSTLTDFYVQYKLLVCMHLCVRCFAFSSASCDSASQNLLIKELSHLAESVFLCKCDWLVSFCISLNCSPDFSLLLHCPTLMLPSPSYGVGWDLLTHFCCSPGRQGQHELLSAPFSVGVTAGWLGWGHGWWQLCLELAEAFPCFQTITLVTSLHVFVEFLIQWTPHPCLEILGNTKDVISDLLFVIYGWTKFSCNSHLA